MWFFKSKKNVQEEKKEPEFKLYTKEMWWNMTRSVQEIKKNYWIRDCHYRNDGVIYDMSEWHYYDFEDKNESFFYFRLKNMLEFIGDGWGRDFPHQEIVYITDDFIISNASGHHEFIELENGDLLVKERIVTKKAKNKTITEIDGKRYTPSKWRKKVIDTTYDKQLIEDEDYATLELAKDYCLKYEALCKIDKIILEDD